MEHDFGALTRLKGLRFTFDSDLNRTDKNTPANIPLDMAPVAPPATLCAHVPRACSSQRWRLARGRARREQLPEAVRVPLDTTARALRFVPEATWGALTFTSLRGT